MQVYNWSAFVPKLMEWGYQRKKKKIGLKIVNIEWEEEIWILITIKNIRVLVVKIINKEQYLILLVEHI